MKIRLFPVVQFRKKLFAGGPVCIQGPPKFHIKFRNTDPAPPSDLGNIPKKYQFFLVLPLRRNFVQVALYAFKAQADTELSFSKGDRLEVGANTSWIFSENFVLNSILVFSQ